VLQQIQIQSLLGKSAENMLLAIKDVLAVFFVHRVAQLFK